GVDGHGSDQLAAQAALFGLRCVDRAGVWRAAVHDFAYLCCARSIGYSPARSGAGSGRESVLDFCESDVAFVSRGTDSGDGAGFHSFAWGFHNAGSFGWGEVGDDRQSDSESIRAAQSTVRIGVEFDTDCGGAASFGDCVQVGAQVQRTCVDNFLPNTLFLTATSAMESVLLYLLITQESVSLLCTRMICQSVRKNCGTLSGWLQTPGIERKDEVYDQTSSCFSCSRSTRALECSFCRRGRLQRFPDFRIRPGSYRLCVGAMVEANW